MKMMRGIDECSQNDSCCCRVCKRERLQDEEDKKNRVVDAKVGAWIRRCNNYEYHKALLNIRETTP